MELTLDQIKERFDEFLIERGAFQLFYKYHENRYFSISFKDWIYVSFSWNKTSEGIPYWSSLNDRWKELCKDFILVDNFKPKYKIGDVVTFKVGDWTGIYQICSEFLSNKSDPMNNDKIFRELGIKDRREFCSKVYGYSAGIGLFPNYYQNDLAAIDKIIKALQVECDKINSTWKPESKEVTDIPITKKEEQIFQSSFKFYSMKKKTYFI